MERHAECNGCLKPIASGSFCATCASEPIYAGHSRQALSQAFDLVADPTNWKNPIDVVLPRFSEPLGRLIADAVIFYAGCTPRFFTQSDGTIRVKASGYYLAVGA